MLEHIETLNKEAVEQEKFKHERIENMRIQMVKDLDEQLRIKEEIKQKDIEHNERIAQYAKKMEEKKRLAKEKRDRIETERRAIRQRMIDEQTEHLKTLQNNED